MPRGHNNDIEGSITAVHSCHCDENDRILCAVGILIIEHVREPVTETPGVSNERQGLSLPAESLD